MMTCIGRNLSSQFKLIKDKIVVFYEVYVLFYFSIILKHNRISSAKINGLGSQMLLLFTAVCMLMYWGHRCCCCLQLCVY